MKQAKNITKPSYPFYSWIAFLLFLIGFAGYAWSIQLDKGLMVTGMRDIIQWGLYITNFIFFVGLAAAAIVVAAATYLFGKKEYKPITLIGEVIAVVCVILAMAFVIPDLGRPERMLKLLTSPNQTSLLVYDIFVLSVYFVLCLIFAGYSIRCRLKNVEPNHRAMMALAGVSLPFAISIHSVTAWIFGLLNARPIWYTGLLAPIFLSSAFVAGIGLLIFVSSLMSIFTNVKVPLKLRTDLAKLLAILIPVDIFFLLCEILTAGYGAIPRHTAPIMFLLTGPYAQAFWSEIVAGLIAFFLLIHPALRKRPGIMVTAAILAIIGIWLKRFNLLLAGLTLSPLGVTGTYTPTWIEWSIMAGIYAIGMLIFTLIAKLFPLGIELKPELIIETPKLSISETAGKISISRRNFIKTLGTTAVSTALVSTIIAPNIVKAETTDSSSPVKKWAMVIDLRKCIGCQACFAACKSENGVPLDFQYTWVETHEQGKYPDIKLIFLPRLCNHCDNPPCTKVCPVKATYKREKDHIVIQDLNQCIGCRYCMAACPYEVRSFVWGKPSGAWPDIWRNNISGPAKAEHGFVVKCHGCYHRIEKGLKPACVEVCVGGARIFGDLEDPDSQVTKIVRSTSTQRLLSELGTEPKTYYIKLDEHTIAIGQKASGTIIVQEE